MEDLEALREFVSDEFQARGFTDRRSLVQLLRDIADDLEPEEDKLQRESNSREATHLAMDLGSLREKLTSKFGNMVQ